MDEQIIYYVEMWVKGRWKLDSSYTMKYLAKKIALPLRSYGKVRVREVKTRIVYEAAKKIK